MHRLEICIFSGNEDSVFSFVNICCKLKLRKDTDIDEDFTLKSEDFWLDTKEKYTSYYR